MVFIVFITSLFITIKWISSAIFFSCTVYWGMLLLNRNSLDKIKNITLLLNLRSFLIVLLISTGVAFVLISDSNIKSKMGISCLTLLSLIWLFIKNKKSKVN